MNDDFVGLQIVVLESPDEEMADRFIKTLKTNADDRGVRASSSCKSSGYHVNQTS